MPLSPMRQRPVRVMECLWQARLQRRGAPLRDYIEHRQLCLLEPAVPVVAVTIAQYGHWVRIEQEFRRLDVLQRGTSIALGLTFPYGPDPYEKPFPRLVPTREQSMARTPLFTEVFWRPAMDAERPQATKVFLQPGRDIGAGRAVEVARTEAYPRFGLIRLGMVLVDLEEVKGLRCGSWRLRKGLLTADLTWSILATGRKRVDVEAPHGWEGWEA